MGHLSEETKAKISAAHKGKPRHFTEEWIANMVAARKGYHHSAETKAKIGASNKGKHDMRGEKNPMFGRRGEKAPMFGKHQTADAKAKLSVAHMGERNPMYGKHLQHTEECKAQLSTARMGANNPFFGKQHTKETRAKISAIWTGRQHTKETRAKMSANQMGENNSFYGKHHSAEALRKMMLAMNIKPNGPERKLDNILSKNWPNEWKYVGDGQVSFDGLCPDFINCNSKKLIIELFGDYWHSPEMSDNWRRSELGRIMVFSQFGYKTLVIWERELRDESRVVLKIKQFERPIYYRS